ncbi:serine hydrolase [uncultured Erythrobacter sp.]|uniref:serine hydrolase domain-containing protein n=1 Tax=uncultured Erythrobacter sp. TaxID=263913 RepID=UPI002636289B|nr:serine hydrolase [uncultured Erythrobacter sp.]
MFKRLVSGFALGLLLGSCSPAEESPTAPAIVVVAFDRETIEPLIVEGIADRTSGRFVEANDPVRIASISKLIMALAAIRLAEDGVVDLEADVSEYLGYKLRSPGFPDAPVTLAQLLSHRAGLRDAAGYVIPLGESLEDRLKDPESWYADTPPGEAPFEYANIGSPVVASVLEAASGERYNALLERLVFGPLEVEACANWIGCSPEMAAQAVTLYRDTGEIARDDPASLPPSCTLPVADGVECTLDDYVPGSNASVFSPQGGVRIGMVDLARIGQALVQEGDGLLTEKSLTAMLGSADPPIEGQEFFCGYGYHVQALETPERECMDPLFNDGIKRYGHAGEAYGLRSGLWFDPVSGTGIAYFISAIPPRQSAEDEGGFDDSELALIARAQKLLVER